MRLRRINAISAAVSLVGAFLWLMLGDPLAAFIWFVCSVVWVGLSVAYAGSGRLDPHPVARIGRRLFNLLIFS